MWYFVRLFLVLLTVLFSSSIFAVDYTWVGGGDNKWETSSQWNPSGVPSSGDNAIIGLGFCGANSTTYTYAANSLTVENSSLNIGDSSDLGDVTLACKSLNGSGGGEIANFSASYPGKISVGDIADFDFTGNFTSGLIVEKTGAGTFNLSSEYNDASFDIKEGSLVLKIDSTFNDNCKLSMASGSNLTLNGSQALGKMVDVVDGSTIDLGSNNLDLLVEDDYSCSASIVGPGTLRLFNSGGVSHSLTLGGTSANSCSANVIQDSTLILDKPDGVDAVSGILTIAGTELHEGIVKLNRSNQMADDIVVNLPNYGVLNLNGNNETIGFLSGGTSPSVDLGSGTLTISGGVIKSIFEGSIDGAGGNLIVGENAILSLTLDERSNYSGTTTIKGTLEIYDSYNLGSGDIIFDPGAGVEAFLTVDNYSFTTTIENNVSLQSGTGNFSILNAFVNFASGAQISGSGRLGVAGELDLSGMTNGYTGGTIIREGYLTIDSPDNIGSGDITFDPGIDGYAELDIYTSTTINNNINLLSGEGELYVPIGLTVDFTGDITFDPGIAQSATLNIYDNTKLNNVNVNLQSGTGYFYIDDTTVDSTSLNQILGTGRLGVSSNFISPGYLDLSGMSNSYSGGTRINAGNLIIDSSDNIGSGDITLGSPGLYFSFSSLIFNTTTTLNNNVNLLFGALFDISTGNTVSFASGKIISGNELFISGEGTLDLSGMDNSYSDTHIGQATVKIDSETNLGESSSGTIYFDEGTLNVNGDVNSYSKYVVISSHGTFDVNDGFTAKFNPHFSGGGTLIKEGKGTLWIASDSYPELNGFEVNNGTLKGNSKSINANIATTNNSSVVFDVTGGLLVSSYSYIMSGTGSLTKTGSGGIILTENNTYSGGTTISEGSLSGTTRSIPPGDIINNAGLTYRQEFDGTISSGTTISGVGNFVKRGIGKVIYNGSGFTQNSLTIAQGEFSIKAPITAETVSIFYGATLSGTSTLNGSVNCLGTISPGTSIGTINIVGNLNFDTTSTLVVEFSPDTCDLLNVTGNVDIASGATIDLLPESGSERFQSKTYLIISSTGGITGQFSNVYSPYPALKGTLLYDQYNLQYLVLGIVNFADIVGGNTNAHSVAEYLDSIDPPAGSDLDYVYANLQTLQEDEMADALDQMQPAIFKGFAISQEVNSVKMTSLVSDRARSIYGSCCTRTDDCYKNGVWIAPYGDFFNQGGYSDLKGFDTDSGGILFGYDRKVHCNTYLGATLGYSYSSLDWNRCRGKGDINSLYLGCYSFWIGKRYYLNAEIYGAFNNYSGKRNIKFSEIDRAAKNSHIGGEFIGHVDGGFYFQSVKQIEVIPNISVDYMFIHENGFKEHGADSLNLVVGSTNYQLWRTEVGMNFTKCFERRSCKFIIPEVGFSWIEEISIGGKCYRSHLVDEPGHFIVHGIDKNVSLFSPYFNLRIKEAHDRGIYSIGYKGEFGKHRCDNNFFMELIFKF